MVNTGSFIGILFYVFTVFATNKVPAVQIISISIAIIIFTIAANFFGVRPQNLFQIFVQRIDTRIDDCYYYGLSFEVFSTNKFIGFIDTDPIESVFGFVEQMPSLRHIA